MGRWRGARLASSWLCVTITIVTIFWEAIFSRVSETLSAFTLSRLPVGSSARRIFGLPAKARAMAARCISPPLNWCGKWRARPESPTKSSISATLGLARRAASPLNNNGSSTFSASVMAGRRLKNWKMIPRSWRRYRVIAVSPTL